MEQAGSKERVRWGQALKREAVAVAEAAHRWAEQGPRAEALGVEGLPPSATMVA